MQNVPILNDHVDMRLILNGNLSIHSIHLKPKKDPFPSKLCSHIPSRMDPSQTPGIFNHHYNSNNTKILPPIPLLVKLFGQSDGTCMIYPAA